MNREWLEHDGKKVKINGITHKLKVTSRKCKYPYLHEIIDVSAYPANRYSQYYLNIKKSLGDDWSTDVLSSLELECEVLGQLQEQARDHKEHETP